MEEFVIRQMTEADIKAVVGIEQDSFSIPWSETSFLNEILNPHSNSKVAVIGEKIAGYVCASLIADEGHILNLSVHPDFRRKGIAKALVQETIVELREDGCRILYLEVRASNDAASRLYQGFGFRIFSMRKAYYTDPVEDAVIMYAQLNALKTNV